MLFDTRLIFNTLENNRQNIWSVQKNYLPLHHQNNNQYYGMDPLSAGITAAGGIISSIFGMKSNTDTNKANMELAKYQYEKALEMWNKQNEYNTPSAQRQRMEDAGFNPNLVYGHGSVANTASPAPQYQAPTLQAYTNFPNIGAEVANMILASRKNQAEVRKIEAEADGAEQDARTKRIDADVKEKYGHDTGRLDYHMLQSKDDLLTYERNLQYRLNQHLDDLVNFELTSRYYDAEKKREEYHKLLEEITKTREEINEVRAKTRNLDASTDYIKGPQTAQAYSAVRLNNSNAAKADEDTKYRAFENKWHFLNQSFEWRNLNARTRNLISDLSTKVLNRQVTIHDAAIRARKILVDEERLSLEETKVIWGMISDALEVGIGIATLIP